ncbi:hypothetical protein EIN_093430 [Entamoeba invadens IP1]|uniref:FHA domain-containing protein n=1 Tax=Entamoeba invadens IP1 TaxID=370355 RepID=A0A0A1U5T0_ENTIV|nr:hypothetical protein EIN_093430 [Entamoeba invadens IP1]ELP87186.1 hypothetical protein EIN_093430 [Entamoeba invadens IP1]|eukprot:XP_004253957.1 hypothetical protein EIN_093430 [Entamoeba invadens IP1]
MSGLSPLETHQNDAPEKLPSQQNETKDLKFLEPLKPLQQTTVEQKEIVEQTQKMEEVPTNPEIKPDLPTAVLEPLAETKGDLENPKMEIEPEPQEKPVQLPPLTEPEDIKEQPSIPQSDKMEEEPPKEKLQEPEKNENVTMAPQEKENIEERKNEEKTENLENQIPNKENEIEKAEKIGIEKAEKMEINDKEKTEQVEVAEKKEEPSAPPETTEKEEKVEKLEKIENLPDAKVKPNQEEMILGDYKYCRFCEGEPYETKVCYLPIVNNRVGNFPIVLKLPVKCQSNYICLHHWRENRREYLEHFVQKEKDVIDEASVLLYASMLDKKINFNYVPSVSSIPDDTKNLFSKYLTLRRQEMEMAMGSVPAGLSVTSDLLCNACNAPTQQMFDMSLFPQSFVQFLAWQRLLQIYSKLDAKNVEMLNALKKEGIKEAEKVVKEATKFAVENPGDARKRLQPEFAEKLPPKKVVKSEMSPSLTLPPISSPNNVAAVPPVNRNTTGKTKVYPYFENEANKTKMINLTKPEITIGRKGRDNIVDLDLSTFMEAKSISHLHAIVKYDKDAKKWVCYLKGRNGLKIDQLFKGKDTSAVLQNGSVLESGNFIFSFHCPDEFDGTF